jgi:hypothetical protein
LNLIVNNTLLKDKIEVNSDFALQVDTLKQDKRNDKKEIIINNDIIMNGDVPYVLVHQYDRNEELNNLIENKYK